MAKQIPLPKQYPVPANWCWTDMGKVVRMKSGFPFDSSRFSPEAKGKRPLIRIRDVLKGETATYTDEDCPEEYIIHAGEILIGMDGDFNVAKRKSEDALLNQRVCCIASDSGVLLDDFLYYYLPDSLKKINDATPSVTVKHLSTKTLSQTPFPLPPLAEQHRIVARIESLFAKLDEAKEKAQVVVDGFETRKAAILHKAFTGELTKRWRHNNGINIESWKERDLSGDFEIVGGIQKTPLRTPQNNLVPYLTVANVFRDRIDLSDVRYFEIFDGELEKYQLRKKDILIVEGNGSGNEIGRCAIWRNELPICIHQNHIIRLRQKTNRALPEYVLLFLNSSHGKNIMKARAKTTAGLFNLSTGKIRSIPVPYPLLSEQMEIVRISNRLIDKENSAKDAAEAVLDQICSMKKTILARAFHGELGTNDPVEESAVELLKGIL